MTYIQHYHAHFKVTNNLKLKVVAAARSGFARTTGYSYMYSYDMCGFPFYCKSLRCNYASQSLRVPPLVPRMLLSPCFPTTLRSGARYEIRHREAPQHNSECACVYSLQRVCPPHHCLYSAASISFSPWAPQPQQHSTPPACAQFEHNKMWRKVSASFNRSIGRTHRHVSHTCADYIICMSVSYTITWYLVYGMYLV